MTTRAYGQYCGLARALEAVGERWALLIVRDLLVAPKRFTDLLRGLPGIPSNVLTTRLKELESAGIVRRRVQPRPDRGVVYEMTEHGAELEPAVVALGLWGAKKLGDPRPDEIVTPDSLIMALRTTFRPAVARDMHAVIALRVGPIALHARIDDGHVVVAQGAPGDADVIVHAGPGIRRLMAGEISPQDAIALGDVHVEGDMRLFERFPELFRIDPLPAER